MRVMKEAGTLDNVC